MEGFDSYKVVSSFTENEIHLSYLVELLMFPGSCNLDFVKLFNMRVLPVMGKRSYRQKLNDVDYTSTKYFGSYEEMTVKSVICMCMKVLMDTGD